MLFQELSGCSKFEFYPSHSLLLLSPIRVERRISDRR